MRIVLSVTNDLVTDQRVNRISLSLMKLGHQLTLIGRQLPDSLPVNKRPYNVKRMRLLFRKGALFYAEYNFRLFWHLLFSNYDVLVANDLDTLLANYLASVIRRKTVVYDSHEYFTEVPELIGRNFARNTWLKIERWILPKIKHTYTVCQSIADEYNRIYGINMQLVRNVPMHKPDLKNLVRPDLPDTKLILYQGALNVGRGIEYVIEAMQYIDNATLVVIGDGDVRNMLHELTDKLALNERVRFIARIPFEQLYSYTCFADVGISLQDDWGLSYRYVLPNRMFDYIQANVPVLASPLPEMQSIVNQYGIGIVVENHEIQTIVKALKIMLSDDKLRETWKLNLKKAAQDLCWEREEVKLKEIYTF